MKKDYYVEGIHKNVKIDPDECYIGIDLGTTNSTLSYLDIRKREEDYIQVETEAYRESVEQAEYIPTVVAFNQKNGMCSIGRAAKKSIGKKGMDAYDCFKLRLGRDFDLPLHEKGKSAGEITYVYLDELLKKFKEDRGIQEISKIVATIPETWFRESSNRIARENIKALYQKIGYEKDQIILQSEPIAACAYYCWCYQKKVNCLYEGHIMVVDYGGGTLDVTLCQVTNGSVIKVLEHCGSGEYNKTNGCAGVAFDENVTEKICMENQIDLHRNEPKFDKIRNKFEEEKITHTKEVREYLEQYYVDEDTYGEDAVFQIDYSEEEIDVYCKQLGRAFDEVNKKPLLEAVEQMKNFFPVHGVNADDGKCFQVLLIGGFSNFYGVEHAVRQAFGSAPNWDDNRFGTFIKENGEKIQVFAKEDRSLAVSKGAALIAADVITVDPACPYDIGITAVKQDPDTLDYIDTDIVLIAKGENTKNGAVKYIPQKVEVSMQSGKLRMFRDDKRPNQEGMERFVLDKSCAEVFPNINVAGNKYSIGISVDNDMIITLHIKDSTTKVETSLQSLLERISVRLVDDGVQTGTNG